MQERNKGNEVDTTQDEVHTALSTCLTRESIQHPNLERVQFILNKPELTSYHYDIKKTLKMISDYGC